MASTEIRDRRRTLRYRHLLVHKSHKISQGRVARGLRSETENTDVQQHIDLAAS